MRSSALVASVLLVALCAQRALAAPANVAIRSRIGQRSSYPVPRRLSMSASPPQGKDTKAKSPPSKAQQPAASDPWESAAWKSDELWVRFCEKSDPKDGKICFKYLKKTEAGPGGKLEFDHTCVMPKSDMAAPELLADNLAPNTIVRWYFEDVGDDYTVRAWEKDGTAHGFEFNDCDAQLAAGGGDDAAEGGAEGGEGGGEAGEKDGGRKGA